MITYIYQCYGKTYEHFKLLYSNTVKFLISSHSTPFVLTPLYISFDSFSPFSFLFIPHLCHSRKRICPPQESRRNDYYYSGERKSKVE